MQGKIRSLAKLMHFIMKLKRLGLHSHGGIKEGRFSVLACNGGEKKRFVVGIRHLKNPEFVRLLDLAREEYGFRNDGLLVLPCLPDELEKILEDDVDDDV